MRLKKTYYAFKKKRIMRLKKKDETFLDSFTTNKLSLLHREIKL